MLRTAMKLPNAIFFGTFGGKTNAADLLWIHPRSIFYIFLANLCGLSGGLYPKNTLLACWSHQPGLFITARPNKETRHPKKGNANFAFRAPVATNNQAWGICNAKTKPNKTIWPHWARHLRHCASCPTSPLATPPSKLVPVGTSAQRDQPCAASLTCTLRYA